MKINFSLEGSCSGARLRPLNLFERILRSQVYNFIHDLSMDKLQHAVKVLQCIV